jgi:hypothetical protein
MIPNDRLRQINDSAVPAVSMLLTDEALDVLNVALTSTGGVVQSVRAVQVRYTPTRSLVVQYTGDVSWQGEPPRSETLIAASGIKVPEGAASVQSDSTTVSVWRYPDDPFLPGLATAASPAKLARIMEQLGVTSDDLTTKRRAYRPGRRAVLEVTSANGRIFLKVVRPAKVVSLQSVHAAMVGHVPVPQSLGWSEDLGLVALQAVQGTTLRRLLEAGSDRLPHPRAVLDLLDALPITPATSEQRGTRSTRLTHQATLLRAVTPELSDRIDRAVHAMSDEPDTELVAVHGDFHASQLLIGEAAVVGLVDVDTAGIGHRIDDLGNLLGQIATISLSSPHRRGMERYGTLLIKEFDLLADPVALRLSTAASIFGFATGPFRVLQKDWPLVTEQRLGLCERWIASAGEARK